MHQYFRLHLYLSAFLEDLRYPIVHLHLHLRSRHQGSDVVSQCRRLERASRFQRNSVPNSLPPMPRVRLKNLPIPR